MTVSVGAMTDLQVAAVITARGLDVTFSVAAGEVLALVGPNGAGKSTTAAVIAGLLRGDSANIRAGGRTLTDTERGLFVPVHQRRVGLLAQEPLLFPHLSVLGNVQFAAGRGSAGRRTALDWLDRVGAAGLAGRRPRELSGGQAQRVALARALAADPQVLVLDEPLAGLDVAAATALRASLRSVLARAGRSAVLITHDLLDIIGLADRVAVIEAGRIAEIGTVAELLSAPRSQFGARIAGVNAVRGVLESPGVLVDGGQRWYGIAAEELQPGADAVAVFAPVAVAVYREEPHGSPRNSVSVHITALDVAGGVVRVHGVASSGRAAGISADITPEAVADLRLGIGERVWFSVKAQEIHVHGASRSGR
jgi:molybdate transport system ATP-binding protein